MKLSVSKQLGLLSATCELFANKVIQPHAR